MPNKSDSDRPAAQDGVVEADESPRPVKKQRRQRPSHSCAECRRLKLKCDRQAPCSNCVRRHRVEHCTKTAANGVSICPGPNTTGQGRYDAQAQRPTPSVEDFESQSPPAPDVDVTQEPIHQGQLHVQRVVAEQGYADVSSRPPTDCIENTLNEVIESPCPMRNPPAGAALTSETQFAPDSASVTRAPFPVTQPSAPLQSSQLGFGFAPIAFPFNASAARTGIRDLLLHLPPREEALTLVESYYRYCAWHHDVAPKPAFQKTFDRVYTFSNGGSVSPRLDPQEIALVYIIMAQGTMFNIEMPYYDPSVEEWLYLSERALVEGNFLSNDMVVGLQTLHLMAHLHLQLDKGGRGDTAWPLWGLVMPQFEAAIEASPEPSRRSMTISFQQSNLALNISETIINLHRPYYAKALYEEIDDRLRSVHAPSFMTVIERCAIILSIVNDIHRRFPAVSTRQWNFWYHVFGSALCLGTLVLRDPRNPMATFVLGQIDIAIELFTSLVQPANTPRYRRNLQWLVKLRARVSSKISTASTQVNSQRPENAAPANDIQTDAARGDREDSEDVELLGWRTRLIERADHQNRHTIRTIPLPGSLNDSSDPPPRDAGFENTQSGGDANLTNLDPTMPNVSFPWVTPDSTDGLLHDFWDPMLLHDIFGPAHE
ncbi:hypothetical protein BDW72DRAFT_195035 [Aspergillus terricola var. indicus]